MNDTEDEKLAEGTLISHLVELRSRMMKSLLAVGVVFLCLVPFSQRIFTAIAAPLMSRLPEGATMIATQVASPFLTPFKTTLFVALFVAMPAVLYQAWAFIAPGLYRREKRFALPLLVSSIVLFYTGIAFAYYLVFPLMFGFFVGSTPEGVAVMTDINSYLTFVLTLFLAFGLSFEVPIGTVLLIWSGLIDVRKLRAARPYVFLGAFVVGMFLTPPDVISQTLLALPMYMLYEGGLIMARFLLPEKMNAPQEEAEEA
ncbi:MAG TPA: twin-arginine translocase subunit TatC [Gammaproteobacteria bacterium]